MSNGGSLRQIRRRIRSVENTKKITRAMEMVAAAKLRRFQDFLDSARPYTEKIETLLNRLTAELPPSYTHPYLVPALSPSPLPQKGERVRGKPDADLPNVLLVLFTSDTGLCGSYNFHLEERARAFLEENPGKTIHFVSVGKYGANAFRNAPVARGAHFEDLRVSRVDQILEGLRKTLETGFLAPAFSEIVAIYTRMESLSRCHVTEELLLPLNRKKGPAAGKLESGDPSPPSQAGFIIEPNLKTVLDKLIPAVFEARLRFIFYHALLTEQIARMTAMRQATQNAEEMVEELALLRNKARQASITKEIIEVVSGSRALKF